MILQTHSKHLSGSALAITLLTIAAITSISLGLASIVPDDFRQSRALEQSLNAENAAWAGVEHSLLLLRQASEKNDFYEIATERKKAIDENRLSEDFPYGQYPWPTSNSSTDCYLHRDVCPGIDRQLGILKNGTPLQINNILAATDPSYGIVV